MAHGRGKLKTKVLDATSMNRALKRIAHEIVERNPSLKDVALIGIRTRGYPLAERLARMIKEAEGTPVDLGFLDIGLNRSPQPSTGSPAAPFAVTGKTIILVDDVLHTGWTIRAAMEALSKNGRPRAIQAAVLIDQGHRELPLHADYVGKNVPTAANEIVLVFLRETDHEDEVVLAEKNPDSAAT